jgi:hypothetical protein
MNPSEIEALLAAAKNPPPVDAATKLRVAARVDQTIAVMPQPSWWKAGPVKILAFSSVAAASLWTASHLRPAQAPPPRVAVQAAPAPIVLPVTALAPEATVKARPVTKIATKVSAVVAKPAPLAADEVTADRLEEERRLLDTARSALVHHHADSAASSLEKHQRDFPKAVLAEERDALWVQVDAATGDNAKARAAAHAFLLAYPESVLKATVLDTLAKITAAKIP